jgi:hypothetical protein
LNEAIDDRLTATPSLDEGCGFILIGEGVTVENLTTDIDNLDFGVIVVIGSEDIHCGDRLPYSLKKVKLFQILLTMAKILAM